MGRETGETARCADHHSGHRLVRGDRRRGSDGRLRFVPWCAEPADAARDVGCAGRLRRPGADPDYRPQQPVTRRFPGFDCAIRACAVADGSHGGTTIIPSDHAAPTGNPHANVANGSLSITVVGHAAVISAGEFIQASGEWANDHTHGVQFRARFLKTMPPTTTEGIEKYLGSGMIRGIGPAYARNLVRTFGSQVFDVIEAEPHRLREVAGIGPKRADGIATGWAEQRAIREIMIFLHANGVGTSRAVRIYKTYGADAIQVISEDPYRLARDIRGIGFKTADALAMKLGIDKTAMIRARAGISFALTEALDDGHCGLPRDDLLPLAVKLLEIPDTIVLDALRLELDAGQVIADQVEGRDCVFLGGLYRAERSIADRLRILLRGSLPWKSIDAEKAIPWVEARPGVALAASQKTAIHAALRSKVMVITGGPGVGKTTLVNSILRILAAKKVCLSSCARRPDARPNARPRRQDTRRRRSIGFLRSTPRREASARTKKVRSTVISSWSMRLPWSTWC